MSHCDLEKYYRRLCQLACVHITAAKDHFQFGLVCPLTVYKALLTMKVVTFLQAMQALNGFKDLIDLK